MLGQGTDWWKHRHVMWHRTIRLVLLLWMLGFGALPPLLAQTATTSPPAQTADAPEVASYQMDVQLDPAAKTVAGTGRITYRNPSPATLDEVWLRLYLKAFSSPDTVWMQEAGGMHRGNAADPASIGDISVDRLALADGTDLLAGTTVTDTLMRVPLPEPLAPDEQLELDVSWTSKLPRVFARTGYGGRDDTFFMVGQWYPKMAVYDRGRWDTEPWHVNSEFFHDFGSYDVQITVPEEYVVAATGVPTGEQAGSDGTKTVRFTATDVTDFAFAASPDFQTTSAKAGAVDVVLFYLPEHEGAVAEYMTTATGSLEAFSNWYGAYPHPRLTLVDVPDDAQGAGGMEYPTLITGGTAGLPPGSGGVALVTSHEVGHQWWPMQTATNEGREPWLDEGLTEYSGIRYLAEAGRNLQLGPVSVDPANFDRASYSAAPNAPSNLPAWEYENGTYGSAVYNKTAVGLWTLENVVGTEQFRRAMAEYLEAYRFKHPVAEDFRQSMETSLGDDLDWFFDDYIAGDGVIDYAVAGIETTATGSTVTLQRQGEVRAPVDVQVTRASGVQETEVWDGATETTSLSFDATDPVVMVEIDPEQKLVAELDVLDNGRTAGAQVVPALTLGGRLSFWLQTLLNMLGLMG